MRKRSVQKGILNSNYAVSRSKIHTNHRNVEKLAEHEARDYVRLS
jgi:hypothetical protein